MEMHTLLLPIIMYLLLAIGDTSNTIFGDSKRVTLLMETGLASQIFGELKKKIAGDISGWEWGLEAGQTGAEATWGVGARWTVRELARGSWVKLLCVARGLDGADRGPPGSQHRWGSWGARWGHSWGWLG